MDKDYVCWGPGTPWKTKAEFFSKLRGDLRKTVWSHWPLKNSFKNEICKPPPPGYTGRAKSGAYCALSGEWVGKSAAQIDHIKGNVSLRGWEDVATFVQHMCAPKSNMQYVSKEAHAIKSYAEQYGLTYEEAAATKQAIRITDAKEDVDFLKDVGIIPGSNQAKRRAQIVKYLLEQK